MRILIAHHGSHGESDEPVALAARFPWPEGSEIHVISVAEVVRPIVVGMVPDAIDASDVQITTDAEARRSATSAVLPFQQRGLQAEGIVAKGDPETEILEHAKDWGADLIVVGSHDRSLIEKLLVGSVSDRVVKHSPCSVLVVKSGFAA